MLHVEPYQNAMLAERLADELFAALPPHAKDMWLSARGEPKGVKVENDGKDSVRCFLPYRETNLNGKTDWESMQAAVGVLRFVVPIVCDVAIDRMWYCHW